MIASPVCPICGESQWEEMVCQRCVVQPPSFKALRSWAEFIGPLRQALHRLKYRLALGKRLTDQPVSLSWARETRSQVCLSANHRRDNVAGAFVAERKDVLIVDDVSTSGARLHACFDALLNAGANRVYGFTFA